MIQIASVQSGEPLEQMIALSQEYVSWMLTEIRRHYPELDLAEFTAEHEYDDIRRKFPGEHRPPDGCLLIARQGDLAAGCIALGRLSAQTCEMRTLFVRPAFRGAGVGRQLVEASLQEARGLGYARMRLDTLGFMESALRLYRSYGFYDIEPYRELSDSVRPFVRFLELRLATDP